MILSADSQAVMFKCAPAYYSAVENGKKRAEVRLMDSHEEQDFLQVAPKYIVLTDLYHENAMCFRITYANKVADILGTGIWLICFTGDDE